MISVRFQGKPFNITVIQVYAPTSNAEEAEVEWFYEDLQDLLELKPKKDVLFIIGDWNAKVGSQETPGVTGKFGIGIRNEAGQRLTEFCQENTLVIENALFQKYKRRGGGLSRVRGTECSSECTGPFEGGCHYLPYFHCSLVSGQTTGREHIPAHQQKIGLKIY